MKRVNFDGKIFANDDVWELMDTNQRFNDFIGQCITHFIHFVIPRRDQTKEITEYYPIPKGIEGTWSDTIEMVREDNQNNIYIYYYLWV